MPAGRHAATDPLRALRQWLGARGGTKSVPVFTRVSRTGVVLGGGLSGQSVNTILRRRASYAGVELDGHSTRASHMTEASRAGVALERIMKTSRHSSVTVAMRYVRGATAIQDSSAGSLGL